MTAKACALGRAALGTAASCLLSPLQDQVIPGEVGATLWAVARGEELRPPASSSVNEPSWLGKLLEHCGLANAAIAN